MRSRPQGSWILDLPINRKILLGVFLILLAFVVSIVATLYTFTRVNSVRAENVRTFETIEKVLLASRLMREQDVAVKNYLVFANDARRAKFNAVSVSFNTSLEELPALFDDSQDQRMLIQQIQEKAVQWQVAARNLIDSVPRDPEQHKQFMTVFAQSNHSGLGDRADEIVGLLERAFAIKADHRNQLLSDVRRMQDGSRNLNIAALLGGILGSILIVWLTERYVSNPVRVIASRMTALADGDQSIDVPGKQRGDEIGDIARALEVFKEQSIQISTSGWIKAQVAGISDGLPRASSPAELAETLLSELADRLDARVGVFYLMALADGEPVLQLYASWGLRQRKNAGNSYRVGEGLVGQCARERKPIVLEQVPEDYIRIHSGVGETAPRCVAVVPLVLEGQVLAVLELGLLQRLDPAKQTVLDELAPRIALVLDNLRRARHTEELLRETQSQARRLEASEEELRGQQDALFAANEDLQAKTVELEEQSQRLQVSEEELRVQAEELQASNEELRLKTDTLNEQKRLLEQLQLETQHRADELARASQYKSDFLANMSHELRTPLNSLLILSRSLSENETGNLDADEVESARVIHQSGSNLLRLINDILDLSKIEAGKMELACDEIYLHELVAALQSSFRPIAADRELSFDVTLEDDLPETFFSDPGRVEQIANNLLGNAFKFTREGGVKLVLALATAEQAAEAGVAAGQAITLCVHDTGIGIDASRLSRMFEPFEQADASTSRHYGGSGLGLSIARRLAQLLGGSISATSEPGVGSTFMVVLPIGQRAASGAARTVALPGPLVMPASGPRMNPSPTPARTLSLPVPGAGGEWVADDRQQIKPGDICILAIEDDPMFARVLVDLIRRKGYRALAAGDGETGLELARRFEPTGVILDVLLPGMDGWQVIERLKADPVTRGIPVHFVSATDESGRGEALGAVGFLTKPADRDAVLRAFERLLAHAEHRTRHVLLIDDDEESRHAITTLVASDQVQVEEVRTAEEGLERLRQGHFDCVVLDLGLPGMSGFEFLEVASRSGPVPPVVIYSARELSTDESMRLRQHTDSIVIKGSRSSERLLDEISLFMHSIRPAGNRVVRHVDPDVTGRTVLVVDDDMRNVFALSKALRDRGVNVVMAQDGEKALRQLRDNPSIELVLMDIMMPGMDGYETTREIRKQPRFAKLPIIAVTAKAMPDDRDKCLQAGANDYLAKPIDIDRLMSMVRVWLQA